MQSLLVSHPTAQGEESLPHTVWCTPAGIPQLSATSWASRLVRRLQRHWSRMRRAQRRASYKEFF